MPIARIRRTLDELGAANGLLYLIGRALQYLTGGRAFIVHYHFFAQPVPVDPNQCTRPTETSRVRQVLPNDPITSAFPRPAQVIAQRFANGHVCFAAEIKGRFAGFIWLAKNAYEEDEIRCRYELHPPETCAWDFDVYVAPEYRIGRTFSKLWEAANAYLAQLGIQWSLSRISSFNTASLAAHGRLKLQKLCSATFVTLGPLQISFLPGRARMHLTSRPVIKLFAPQPNAPKISNAT